MSRSTQTVAPVDTKPAPVRRGTFLTTSRSLGLGLLAGIGASLCCLPILLLLAGAGGAWMGTLTAMEPYRPYFMALAAVFLAVAFRKLYLMPPACAGEPACAVPRTIRRQRALFWVITAAVLALVGIPWYAPLLVG